MISKYTLLTLFLAASILGSAQNVTTPAEFERNEGLLLKWNYEEAVDSTVARIAAIVSENDKVWMLYDPSSPTGTQVILNELLAKGANPANIQFMEGRSENPWLRDYGPVTGYQEDGNGIWRHFLDSDYDAVRFPEADFIPIQLASDFSYPYDAMPLHFEGGNLSLDGIGRGFVSDRVLSSNPGMAKTSVIQSLYTWLSLNEIIVLPSVPECGGGEWSELSRLVKITDPETALVTSFPASLPYSHQLDLIADTLAHTFNDVGREFTILRLPAATNAGGIYPAGQDDELRSYTSSLVMNDKILIPAYGDAADETALEIYRKAFPGFRIFQIPAKELSARHGSLYRLAIPMPQPEYFRMRHAKIAGAVPFQEEIWVNTFVQSPAPADSIILYYRIHPSAEFQRVNTTGCCGGNSGLISGYTVSDTISYYVEAFGGTHSQTLPLAAPAGTYTFWFDPFTSRPDYASDETVKVYPNPNRGWVHLTSSGQNSRPEAYEVFDYQGKLVDQGRIGNDQTLALPQLLPDGLYLIKLINSGKFSYCKLYLHR
jgi:agmatine/peptidylarginine deiminase